MVKGKGFEARLKEVRRIIEPLSKLSLEKKINKLERLKRRENRIESELEDIQIAITYLEHIPDVALYQILRNRLATGLLRDLIERGDLFYRDLKIPDGYHPIAMHYLDLFKRAELIEMIPDSHSPDYLIKLTGKVKEVKRKYKELAK